ncbi:hypothetical protein WJX82_004270 [Trebouxia sp. C0006]
MKHTAKQRGTRTWSSPARCPVVKRTFEGIILSPEASVSPSNGGPLTRKRRAETSPVIDQPGTIAVVRRKSRKCAHPQLRGRTFRPHDTLAGAVSKSTPTASGHDYMEWSAAYSLDSSAVLQAALTRKPANSAADTCGFQLANVVEAVCHTEACAPADAAAPQHIADNKVSSSRQDVAVSGLGVVHRHQHGSQDSPAGSYSMQTSGSSRPPWDSSSQGTQSLKCYVSIGRPEDASGGDTDSPQAVHRLLASMKQPFVGAAHRSIKKVNADYRSHVEYRRQSGYMQCASDLR